MALSRLLSPFKMKGATSGTTTLLVADAVSPNITLPSVTGTLATLQTPSFTTGIGVGAATAGAGGVAFPATAVAVADVNTLDDYAEYTATSTACSGAITTACVWKAVKVGKMVVLTLPSVSGAGVATPYFEMGVKLPTAFRPADTLVGRARVTNNGANGVNIGMILILTDGTIRVYLDQTGGTNYTVTASAGLANATSTSWMV